MGLKRISSLGPFLYLILFLGACNRNSDPLPIITERDNFVLITNTHFSDSEEIDKVLKTAEILYERILQILGENRRPQNKITIRLEGDYVAQGPYFDNMGIHLFRYSRAENGYLAALAHEMVHSFREDYYIKYDPYRWRGYPFFDEGFAEYVAQLVDGAKTGFPLYGFDEFAVVGDLVLSENWIPNVVLRDQHDELNDLCNIQAYTQRSSWMHYIDEIYGREALLALNFPEAAPNEGFFINVLGASLTSIDSSWQSWVVEEYHNTPQAKRIARDFRERTSWYMHCVF